MLPLYESDEGSIPSVGSKEYHRNWARANREKRTKLNREWRARQRAIVLEAKSKPCTDCGVQYNSWQMQFDHLDNKKFSISNGVNGVSTKRLLEEISKCEVVCANCHANRTHQRALGLNNPI